MYEERLAEADEDSEDSAGEDVNDSQSGTKKRKASTGKVAKGKDFWSQIDQLLANLVKKNGTSLKSPEWRQ